MERPQKLEWAPDEKGYMRQCFKFWNGFTGGIEPDVPAGISNSKAMVLKYKAKVSTEYGKRRKRMDELQVISIKVKEDFYKQLAFDSAQIDVSISVFIRACISLASPQLKQNPKLINFFSEAIIPR